MFADIFHICVKKINGNKYMTMETINIQIPLNICLLPKQCRWSRLLHDRCQCNVLSIEEEVLASIIALHFGSDVFLRWYVYVSESFLQISYYRSKYSIQEVLMCKPNITKSVYMKWILAKIVHVAHLYLKRWWTHSSDRLENHNHQFSTQLKQISTCYVLLVRKLSYHSC